MEDLSDKEQLDAMRAWWAENGNFVLGGIAAGLIIIFGWNRWQGGIADAEITASSLFEDVMYAADLGRIEDAVGPASELYENYGSSPYAAQTRLAMARLYMDKSRDQDAANELQALVDSTPDTEVALIARLRLAKIFLYQGRAEEALNVLRDHADTAFAARYSEVMGDAYAAMGSYAEAEAAYIAALNDNQLTPTVDLSIIQLKINDLPMPSEIAAAAEAAGLDATAAPDMAAENSASPADGVIQESVDAAVDAAAEAADAPEGEPEPE
ncbi:MAG: YfgM family protein [Woeseiaceae bacterium]